MSGGEDSELIQSKQPCEDCGSSDALALYSDGHTHCFSCGKTKGGDGTAHSRKDRPRMSEDLQALVDSGSVVALPKRKLTQATCQHFDYRARVTPDGKPQHIAIYRDADGAITGAKVRDVDSKEFFVVGTLPPLYGMDKVGKGGKMIVLTEGEIDCLTVSQAWGNRFPVVSVPKGAQNAKKDVAKALDLLGRYDKVVICFDMDDPGREAAQEVAKMLPPGKAFITKLPLKDPNEMLLAGQSEQLTSLLHNAAPFTPGGIVSGKELAASALDTPQWGLRYGIDFLDQLQWGWRDGEVVVFGAGSGMGKSDVMYQVAAHILRVENVPCAIFNHEASPVRILKGLAGKHVKKRFTVPDPEELYWTYEELKEAIRLTTEVYAQPWINDAKGSADWTATKSRIRYLAHAHGVKRFFLDPMAAYAAGMEDERKGIDLLMAEAVGLCEELGIGMWWNSHLARPQEGKSHEEGGRVTLRNFRGSGAIIIWAALVVGFERDQQADDPDDRHTSVMRALKVREAGENTGKTASFVYNTINGELEPKTVPFEDLQDQSPEPPQ